MGHPVNSIEYVLKEWDWIQKNEQPAYFAFILFDHDHAVFENFFIKYFLELDAWSGDGCMFFAIAPPPDAWGQIANDRQYWQHYLANANQAIGYDKDAVKQVARYFSIPYEHLPAIVLF